MRVAFYAPLKPPDHPVPSGDRQMARLLMRALSLSGHTVELASRLRAFLRDPDTADHDSLIVEAKAEVARLTRQWRVDGPPALWLAYHPYHKSPDLIGPPLCAAFAIPYVTVEAAHAPRRAIGVWAWAQGEVRRALEQAKLNLCFTARDEAGLALVVPRERLRRLPPFIDVAGHGEAAPLAGKPPRLLTVAMMRPGDKLDSYRMLGAALARLRDRSFSLAVVGDGPARAEVVAALAPIADRVDWLGEHPPAEIPALLRGGDVFVWPGFGEAYGLAYLEASAAGLPVVAQAIAGVPEVVRDGVTGLLVPPGEPEAFADAVARMLDDRALGRRLGAGGRRFVHQERSLPVAARVLGTLLEEVAA